MASSYPGGLDSLSNPGPTDSQAVESHSAQHTAANDAIEAIQAELGTDPAGSEATVKARLDKQVQGPASATDNAVVRFDGTTGALGQNSAVTIDDSGNVAGLGTVSAGAITSSGDLTVNKAAPILTVTGSAAVINMTSTSGEGQINASRPAGSIGGLYVRTAGTKRWFLYATSTSESGSEAGSDLSIARYDDAGAYTADVLTFTRANGRATFASVSTQGIELASSGPRIMSGTGSPEGVVTAPVGSIRFQTDSTVGVTHWRKATGSGNTGWVVLAGDTGYRNVSADILAVNGFTGGTAYLWRAAGYCSLTAYGLTRASGGAGQFYTLPTGFRASALPVYIRSYSNNSGFVSGTQAYINMAGTSESGISFTWPTSDAWPTSLPGT